MTIDHEDQLTALRRVGGVVRNCLKVVPDAVEPGHTVVVTDGRPILLTA